MDVAVDVLEVIRVFISPELLEANMEENNVSKVYMYDSHALYYNAYHYNYLRITQSMGLGQFL